jgi:flagellar L-ring protein precursor FlgH
MRASPRRVEFDSGVHRGVVLPVVILSAAVLLVASECGLRAQGPSGQPGSSGKSGAKDVAPMLPGSEGAEKMNPEIYDTMYQRYLESARQTTVANARVSAIDWMANLSGDPRARRVNDLVSIRVSESIVGSGTADSTLNKASSANLGVPKLFGLESKLPSAVDPTALVSANSDTKFKGGGVTSRTGELTAMMTARVTEVLPNGDLVLEGAREIDINGDRQIVVLTGVVRLVDIGSANVVPSQSIGQLRIRYFGRGLMKDNLKPGFLVRMLNKIF